MSDQGTMLTVTEVAVELRCSKAHVCKCIHGQVKNVTPLPAISMGRRLLVRRTALETWKHANERRLGDAMLPSSLEVDVVDA